MKLNDQIDKMYALKLEKKAFEEKIKGINSEIEAIQQWLLIRLDEVGTTTAKGALASATVAVSTLPQIEDWGAVSEWIMANDGIYLVHRRISSGPWKELRDSGQHVPGIVPYTKTSISLRKLGS